MSEQYACHMDLDEGYKPDACVLDGGNPNDCVYAMRYGKDARLHCGEWKPIKVERLIQGAAVPVAHVTMPSRYSGGVHEVGEAVLELAPEFERRLEASLDVRVPLYDAPPAPAQPQPQTDERAEFERFISAEPFVLPIQRGGPESAWPGSYHRIDVDLAWQVWKAARGITGDTK